MGIIYDEINLLKGISDIDEFLRKSGIEIDYSKLPSDIYPPQMAISFSKFYEIAYLDGRKYEAKGKIKEKTDALKRIRSFDEKIERIEDSNIKNYMEDFRIYASHAGLRLAHRKEKKEEERDNILKLMKEEMQDILERKSEATHLIDEGRLWHQDWLQLESYIL